MSLPAEISATSPSAEPKIENPNGSPIEAPVDFGKKKKKILVNLKFGDKYELTGPVLGQGATSVVRECRDIRHGNLYACKAVSKTSRDFNRMHMLAEIGILSKCKGQEGIIQMIEYFEDDTQFTIIFEKILGAPLMHHIKQKAVFTERDASDVIRDVASALVFLHANGIAHRDIKPDNILCVFPDKVSPVKLVDFDLSFRNDFLDHPRPRTPVGTPEFMSPEIAEGMSSREPYNELCDVWSLGVLLHLLLVGSMPFVGKCGYNCGWDRGQACELCADDLLENIAACRRISFDAQEWQLVSGGAKDLLSRMLVRATQRISAKEILEHPWISQSAPMTALATVARLCDGAESGVNAFFADANDKIRKLEAGEIAPPGAVHRIISKPVLEPFALVKERSLADIHTPKFPPMVPPIQQQGLRRSGLSHVLSLDDLSMSG